MHDASHVRWRVCAVLSGLAVLTASPAAAQTGVEGDEAALAQGDEVSEPGLDDSELDESEAAAGAATPQDGAAADGTSGAEETATGSPAGEGTDGEGTDGAPADDEEEAPAPARGPALRFANSFFSWSNAVTFNTFVPEAQLTHDPTWVMSFNLTPRFYLTDTTFLWLNQGLFLELTDSNDGTYNREPLLDDTLLDLRQLLRWEGFVFQGQIRLGVPASKASQAAGRVLQTGLGLTVTRPFPELAALTVSVTGGYRRWWATRNYVATGEPVYASCEQLAGGAPSFCTHAGGATPARDIVITGLVMSVMPAPGLTVSFQGFYLGLVGDDVATADVPINGGTTTIVDDSPTHWRHFTYFALAVGYDVLPWLNLSLGVQSSGLAAPLYNPDGSVRSPFNPDTQVFLTTTLGLDGLYDELFGAREEELTPEERQRRRQGLASRGSSAAF